MLFPRFAQSFPRVEPNGAGLQKFSKTRVACNRVLRRGSEYGFAASFKPPQEQNLVPNGAVLRKFAHLGRANAILRAL